MATHPPLPLPLATAPRGHLPPGEWEEEGVGGTAEALPPPPRRGVLPHRLCPTLVTATTRQPLTTELTDVAFSLLMSTLYAYLPLNTQPDTG